MRSHWLFLFLLLPTSATSQATSDPTTLWVRLLTAVSSGKGHTGDPVRAIVTVPYADAAGLIIPAGSFVTGQMESPNREKLHLHFRTLLLDGKQYSMGAEVSEVDNGREKVLPDGTILALEQIKKRPSKVEVLLLAAAYAHPAAIAIAEGTKLTLREVDRPSVHYPVGTDIALRFVS